MKTLIRAILLTLLLTLFFPPANLHAQGGDEASPTPGCRLKFEHILKDANVIAILQDHKGFMWLASEYGLYRYDGYEFVIYLHDPDDPHSLSGNVTYSLYEDRHGALWVGTDGGLDKYDRLTDRFIHYRHDPDDPHSITYSSVFSILEDRSGTLWVGTFAGGLNKFDRETERFTRYEPDLDDPHSLSGHDVRAIYEDETGVLWVGTNNGLDKLDRDTGQFTHYQHDPRDPHSLSHNYVITIDQDEDGFFWIGTRGGFNRFDPVTGQFTRYLHDPENPHSLRNNVVRGFFRDQSGAFWIGTDGGLDRMDRATGQFEHVHFDPQSSTDPRVVAIYEDRVGALWLGPWGDGVKRFDPAAAKFRLYQHDPNNLNSLSASTVNAIYEDQEGILWIGTSGRGLNRWDRNTGEMRHYRHDPENSYSLNDDIVTAIYEDRSGALWVGTRSGGLNRLDQETGRFTHYQHDSTHPESLSSNEILALLVDSTGTLWVGTWGGGLNQYDQENGKFLRYRHNPNDPNSLVEDRVKSILEDKNGLLWLGTSGGGLDKFDRNTGKFTHYRHDPDNPSSLSDNFVWAIVEDSAGNLWIGTGNGLNKLDSVTETFTRYGVKDGLAGAFIRGILEDDQGYIWISTLSGLSRFDPREEVLRNYDVRDGLQSNQFLCESAFKSRSGELFFGGPNGLNAFYPDQLTDNPYKPPVVLTDFQLFNKPVPIGGKDSPLQQHINESDHITLSYKQSVFSFEFAALNYRSPGKNQYAYMMEGFEKDWNYVDSSRRFATYTNLPPGGYVFRVKASNNDGVWNEEGRAIRITITPPWWKTWWAYTLYALVAVGTVLGYVRHRTQAQARALAQKEQELAQERLVSERLQRIDKLKDEFLANTSHELRTPLHGIIGLAESLVDGVTGELPDETKHNLSMVVSSGKRLSSLVNDILDFSRLKHQEIKLKLRRVDVKCVADVVLAMSQPLLGRRAVRLVNAVPAALPLVLADEARLQQILYNLVGNAIRFTDRGTVTVSATIEETDLTGVEDLSGLVAVSITDTGTGIPADKLDRIFESFEQMGEPAVPEFGGTGLGLTITKQLVELHGGEIWVESTVGQGSTFTFTLPVSRGDEPVVLPEVSPPFAAETEVQPEHTARITPEPTAVLAQEQAHILVVDDEPVNLQVMSNYLCLHNYRVTPCMSGIEALAAVESEKPDLVLLDVMMPRTSGFEVSRKLRETYSLSELPILMLTVRDQAKDLLAGFEAGANDYLTKPFDKAELLARVDTLLSLKQSEETLRESEEHYHSLFDRVPVGLYRTTPRGQILGANPTLVHMLGHPDRESLLAVNAADTFVDPEDRRQWQALMDREGIVHDFEMQVRRCDGEAIWVEDSARAVRDADGRVLYYEGSLEDITERKRAEEELRRSYVKLQRALEGTVHVLVSAIEMRDPYTAGHQRRVTQLACAIAQEMGFSEGQIEGIRMAGLIHDIGKINVPAEILSNPGPLTEIQFGLIKMHPQAGHDLLKTIEFPWPVAQMVLQHHERMDGSGYPQGLSGDEIIREARILGVADVVEAMASHRPYRSALGVDGALEEISQNRGVLYDPEVVDACLKLFTEKGFMFE